MGISNYEYALNHNAVDGMSNMTLNQPRKNDTERVPFSENELHYFQGTAATNTVEDARNNTDLHDQMISARHDT